MPEIDPLRAIAPVSEILHHGPTGESYERDGPEARWGNGLAQAETPAHAEQASPDAHVHSDIGLTHVLYESAAESHHILLGPLAGHVWPGMDEDPDLDRKSVDVQGWELPQNGLGACYIRSIAMHHHEPATRLEGLMPPDPVTRGDLLLEKFPARGADARSEGREGQGIRGDRQAAVAE